MAYKISDACISCGACAADCPVEAITEGSSQYEIDGDKCIDCGTCDEVVLRQPLFFYLLFLLASFASFFLISFI